MVPGSSLPKKAASRPTRDAAFCRREDTSGSLSSFPLLCIFCQAILTDDLQQYRCISACLRISAVPDPAGICVIVPASDQTREIPPDVGIVSFQALRFTAVTSSVDAKEIVVWLHGTIACLQDRLGNSDRCQNIILSLVVPGHLPDAAHKAAGPAGIPAPGENALLVEDTGYAIDLLRASGIRPSNCSCSARLREVVLFPANRLPAGQKTALPAP